MRKLVYGGICAILAFIGVLLAVNLLGPLLEAHSQYVYYGVIATVGLIMAALGLALVPPTVEALERLTERVIARTTQLSPLELASIFIGLILGLIVASLVGAAVARVALIGPYLAIIAVLMFGYIGFLIGYRRREDFVALFSGRNREPREKAEKIEKEKKDKKKHDWKAPPKILDTSVVIDGRIADIYRTGFLEGDLIVANFVLEELRHIADSSDSLKRNRGRNGLDCLNNMREEFVGRIVISDRDYPQISEVDSKLLKLAQDLQGVVVTNDFNLNKVAQLQGMSVLNINELSNAVKPVVLPGEEMTVQVVKEGKEAGQGIAYFDDGTMIVVENGRRYVGKQVEVVVTSILQTPAGRMVFARLKTGRSGEIFEAAP